MKHDMRVFMAPEGFEKDLEEELALEQFIILGKKERMYWVQSRIPGQTTPELAWAEDSWKNTHALDIESIGDAVKKLRNIAKGWSLYSTGLHRRAQLISDQLHTPRPMLLDFMHDPKKYPQYHAWTLWEENKILYSLEPQSPIPLGQWKFRENFEENLGENNTPPSRAYGKLWELFTRLHKTPKQGDICLDLGASPGGWTWVLLKCGAKVRAFDRSPLHPALMQNTDVEFASKDAFKVDPKDHSDASWVCCDVIAYPNKTQELIENWVALSRASLVFTIKFQGRTDFQVIQALKKIPGSVITHLCHNKHELTWYLVRDATP